MISVRVGWYENMNGIEVFLCSVASFDEAWVFCAWVVDEIKLILVVIGFVNRFYALIKFGSTTSKHSSNVCHFSSMYGLFLCCADADTQEPFPRT